MTVEQPITMMVLAIIKVTITILWNAKVVYYYFFFFSFNKKLKKSAAPLAFLAKSIIIVQTVCIRKNVSQVNRLITVIYPVILSIVLLWLIDLAQKH